MKPVGPRERGSPPPDRPTRNQREGETYDRSRL